MDSSKENEVTNKSVVVHSGLRSQPNKLAVDDGGLLCSCSESWSHFPELLKLVNSNS